MRSDIILKTNELVTALYRLGYKDNQISPTYRLRNMVKLARQHHMIAEAECNGELSQWKLTRRKTIERMITEIAKENGLTVTFSGDPRGFTVKLHSDKPGLYNTFGGQESGYGI